MWGDAILLVSIIADLALDTNCGGRGGLLGGFLGGEHGVPGSLLICVYRPSFGCRMRSSSSFHI